MYAIISRRMYSELINSQAFSESSGWITVSGVAGSPSASTKKHQSEVNLAFCMVKHPTVKETYPKLSSSRHKFMILLRLGAAPFAGTSSAFTIKLAAGSPLIEMMIGSSSKSTSKGISSFGERCRKLLTLLVCICFEVVPYRKNQIGKAAVSWSTNHIHYIL